MDEPQAVEIDRPLTEKQVALVDAQIQSALLDYTVRERFALNSALRNLDNAGEDTAEACYWSTIARVRNDNLQVAQRRFRLCLTSGFDGANFAIQVGVA